MTTSHARFIVGIVTCMVAPLAGNAQEASCPQIDEAVLGQSIVHVHAEGPTSSGMELQHGTGFFVADGGFIVTAGHVVEPRGGWLPELTTGGAVREPTFTLMRQSESGRIEEIGSRAVKVYVDQQIDIALLRVEGADFNSLPLGESPNIARGQCVAVLAFGNNRPEPDIADRGSGHVRTPQAITAEVTDDFRPDAFGLVELTEKSAPNLRESDSGSAVVDENGRVVGILLKGWPRLRGSNGFEEVFAMPINAAAPLLSIAGHNRPARLEDWLANTPNVNSRLERIAYLEEQILDLRTTWSFHPAVYKKREQDQQPRDYLEVLIRKPLDDGYWPSKVAYTIKPTVFAGQRSVPLNPLQKERTFEHDGQEATLLIRLTTLREELEEKLEARDLRGQPHRVRLEIDFFAEVTIDDKPKVRVANERIEYEWN